MRKSFVLGLHGEWSEFAEKCMFGDSVSVSAPSMCPGQLIYFMGMSMLPLSFISIVDPPCEDSSPCAAPADVRHAAEIWGASLSMWLRNVVTRHVSCSLSAPFQAGIPLRRMPCWMM